MSNLTSQNCILPTQCIYYVSCWVSHPKQHRSLWLRESVFSARYALNLYVVNDILRTWKGEHKWMYYVTRWWMRRSVFYRSATSKLGCWQCSCLLLQQAAHGSSIATAGTDSLTSVVVGKTQCAWLCGGFTIQRKKCKNAQRDSPEYIQQTDVSHVVLKTNTCSPRKCVIPVVCVKIVCSQTQLCQLRCIEWLYCTIRPY